MTIRVGARTLARGDVDSVALVRVRARRPLRAAELADRLAVLLGTSPSTLECGGARVEDHAIVGMPPLTEGAQVRLLVRAGGGATRVPRTRQVLPGSGVPDPGGQRRGVVDLALVSGPDCGQRVALGVDPVVVGRQGFASVGIDDPGVSRRHLRIGVGAGGVWLEDLGSTNGTMVDADPLPIDRVRISQASRISLGNTKIRLLGPSTSPGPVDALGEGHLKVAVRRGGSRRPPVTTFRRPDVPTTSSPPSPPWIAMVVPLPIALVLAMIFGPHYLLLAALGPVTMGASWLHERRRYRLRAREASATYARECLEVEVAVQRALDGERDHLEQLLPDPVTTLDVAVGRGAHLWSRAPGHAAFAVLRLGVGTQPSSLVTLTGPSGAAAGTPSPTEGPLMVRQAPVGLRCEGRLFVTGPAEHVARTLANMVGQLAALHDPADLQLAIITDPCGSAPWSWARSLPHARSWRDLEIDKPSGRAALARAMGIDGHRTSTSTTSSPSPTGLPGPCRPLLVAVVPDATVLTAYPELTAAVVGDPPAALGLLVGAADEDLRANVHSPDWPPSGAGWRTLRIDADGTGRLDTGEPSTAFDSMVGDGTAGSAPPPSMAHPTTRPAGQSLVVDGVGEWWCARLAHALAPLVSDRSLRADATKDSCRPWQLHGLSAPLDAASLHSATDEILQRWEARGQDLSAQGPAAVVGMTGESPWAIDLVKDGPHLLIGGTTGSGKSEFLRGLVLGLAVNAPPDLVTFLLIDFKGGSAFGRCASLPHTVGLITDLDASMARRALDSLRAEIHRREKLLAAAGAEDLEGYRSRERQSEPASGGRSALPRLVVIIDEFRVLAQEHPDVMAGIVHCAAVGRSLGIHLVLATQRPTGVISPDIQANVNLRIALRMRDASDSEQVIGAKDSAWISPDSPGSGHARLGSGDLVSFVSARVGAPVAPLTPEVSVDILPTTAVTAAPDEASTATDESALVHLLTIAYELSGHPLPRGPWLPPLPQSLPPDWGKDLLTAESAATIPWGLLDRPAQQRQDVFAWEPSSGPLRIVGGPGSGRSTAVVGLVHRLAQRFGPDDLHVYAVDGGGALAHLADLPHVGAVVSGDEAGRLRRLCEQLEREGLHRRAAGREAHAEKAHVLVVIDEWDRLARPGSPCADLMERLTSTCIDSRDVGFDLVTAGGPLLSGARVMRESRTLCLAGLDNAVLLLHGLRAQDSPAPWPPGRAVVSDGRHHLQFAPITAPRVASGPWRDRLPLPIVDLPLRITMKELVEQSASTHRPSGTVALLGQGHEGPVHWDPLRWGRHLLVSGPGGSGRTTLLSTIAATLRSEGHPTILLSREMTAIGSPTARGCSDHESTSSAHVVVAAGDQEGLHRALADHPCAAILVDDLDTIAGTPVDLALPALIESTDARQALLVVSIRQHTLATAFRGAVPLLAQRQTAVLLAPQSRHDADPLGIKIDLPSSTPPGRGVLVVRGRQQEIQVALTSEDGVARMAA
ncbi:MAG TPA: FtsK/SpoIIIE domain-containing protein [Phycicoccus sp.]|nr:FtsK/SpoIIIE domain-containing protein [Phycicoccus sp.]